MKGNLSTLYTEYPKESPWKRGRTEYFTKYGGYMIINRNRMHEHFDEIQYVNMDIDIDTKRAALKVCASVVSLVSLTGEEVIFMASGTIIASTKNADGTYSNIILTSGSLLTSFTDSSKIEVHRSNGAVYVGCVFAHDPHYNIAIITIQSDASLPVATLQPLDDSISIDRRENGHRDKFPIRPHSGLFNICPGVTVVALGRHYETSSLMAAPGNFSLDGCQFDCKELLRATCKISKPGIGGPLVNFYGDVIGVNFYDERYTPFLPINIVSKCLEHFKKHGTFRRPWLGMEVTNLYAAHASKVESIIENFPNIFKGVIVEQVKSGSPADCAGIVCDDVIIQCGGNVVTGFLEFFGKIWDKAGESVEVVVLREGRNEFLKLTMAVDETSPDKLNGWPLPEEYSIRVERIR